MKQTPVSQTIEAAVLKIQALASNLDASNIDKLNTILWDMEQKASALRSFILNHVVRTA